MLLNSIILAISSSIDSLGIGISYGIKKTLISKIGIIILFIISFLVTSFSLLLGNIVKLLFPENLLKYIGNLLLIFVGIFFFLQYFKKNDISFDFDYSNSIDLKECIFLSIALSLDSFCIGIGGTIIGVNNILFPFLIAIFQFLFLNLGIFLGRQLNNISHLPNNMWSIISGILIILIGTTKLLIS